MNLDQFTTNIEYKIYHISKTKNRTKKKLRNTKIRFRTLRASFEINIAHNLKIMNKINYNSKNKKSEKLFFIRFNTLRSFIKICPFLRKVCISLLWSWNRPVLVIDYKGKFIPYGKKPVHRIIFTDIYSYKNLLLLMPHKE